MTKDEVLSYLRENKKQFYLKYGIQKIGLFGSYARDEQRDDSDVDIVIKMQSSKKNLRAFFGFKRELEEKLGKKVDVGTQESIKPIVQKYIEKEIIYV